MDPSVCRITPGPRCPNSEHRGLHLSSPLTTAISSFDGRFSDGPVWIDYVAGNLSLPLYDYAVGGATTSNALIQGYTGPGSTIPVPSVDEQVKDFLAAPPSGLNSSADAAPLFVLLSGANDVLFNINITAAQSFAYLSRSVEQLRQSYPAAHILLLNYPSLSRLPYAYYASSADKTSLSAYSVSLASLLRSTTDPSAPCSQATTFVDLAPLFADFDYYAEPAAYGFEALGAYGSCLVGAYGEVGDGVVKVCAEGFGVRVWMDEYQ
ncbi:hypothetical protein SLS56_007984 [Neofusicoccum ribis]|uniref:SGNH hydrolase-type esterase domain-containing protein n=1 Tax=Neofusicoccum ribis TaxID=45134 RepID=A0ABR3SLD6_9PEZI